MPIRSQQTEGEKGNPYLPNTVPPLVFEQFQGMNTFTTRPGVDEKQCWWIDGFMPLGERYLRTLYGPHLALAGTKPISFFGFVNIGAIPYCIIIYSDGSISAMNTNTFALTQIALPTTIQNPSTLSTGITQYGSKYVLIVTNQTNGYFIWDGTTFYAPGNPFPTGGTVPLAINGTAIQTYQGRIWIVNGATLTFSAPGAVIDFTSAHGGGSITSTDNFLRIGYTGLVQTNGFLYLIADSSVSYISGVQTSGVSPVTVFTLLNADPEVGTPYPTTITTFGRSVIFANAFGVHINYGAAVTKVSDPLNGIFNTVPNFAGVSPSVAKAILFGVKVFIILVPIIDPFTGQGVNKFLIWDGKKWFASNQIFPFVYIQSQEINSVLTAWGTDGTNLYQLFSQPSPGMTKVVQSKLWDKPIGYQMVKTVGRLYGIMQYFSLQNPAVTVSIDNEVGTSPVSTVITPATVTILNVSNVVVLVASTTPPPGHIVTILSNSNIYSTVGPSAVGQQGILIGMTATTQAQDLAIVSLMIQPEIGTALG